MHLNKEQKNKNKKEKKKFDSFRIGKIATNK